MPREVRPWPCRVVGTQKREEKERIDRGCWGGNGAGSKDTKPRVGLPSHSVAAHLQNAGCSSAAEPRGVSGCPAICPGGGKLEQSPGILRVAWDGGTSRIPGP